MTKLHARQVLLPEGWASNVVMDIGADGRISAIGTGTGGDHSLDLLLPAPVNLHSHAFQRAMSGLTEARGPDPRDSFWTWRKLMYQFLDQLTPDDVEAIAAQVFMEMAEAGYGAVAEFHYLHHGPDGVPYDRLSELSDRIMAAAGQTGLGLTHLPVFYQYGGCDLRDLQGGQRRFGNDFDRYQRLHEDASISLRDGPADWHVGVAPHSLRAISIDGLHQAIAMAGAAPFHMHLAEQVAEVEEVAADRGARPVEWLLDAAEVRENWCLIHCTQMSDHETRALAKTGAVAGLCPITESSLGDGIFPGTSYAQSGGRFGVGSDSNIHISLFEELKTLEYSQRLRDRSRAALATQTQSTGRVLFEAALQGGAQAAGRHSGAIATGNWADLFGLSTQNDWVCGRTGDMALDSLIFSGNGGRCVRDVWSAGRHIVQDGAHIARTQISERFQRVVRGIAQDLG